MAARQKDSALNLAKFIDKKIIVKLSGGREGASGCDWGLQRWKSVFMSSIGMSGGCAA